MYIIKNYELGNFDEKVVNQSDSEKSFDHFDMIDENIIKRDREFAKNNNFEIHPILKEKRGIIAQESAVKDEVIENEIQERLEKVRETAFEKGYQEGKSKGEKDVYEQTKIEAEEKLERLNEVVEDVLKSKIKLIREEKNHVYDLIHKIAKWVILRELSNDGDYLKRLLDNLAREVESNSELVVYVDRESFKNMPEFIDYAEKKLANFRNVKVEIGHDMKGPGIVLCSENEILSGTMEEQMQSLEKILSSCNLENSGDDGTV